MSQEIRLTISGIPMKKRVPNATPRFTAPRIPRPVSQSAAVDLESGQPEPESPSRTYHAKRSFRNIPIVVWVGALWLVVTSGVMIIHLSNNNNKPPGTNSIPFVPPSNVFLFNVSLGKLGAFPAAYYVCCTHHSVLRCGTSSPTQCIVALRDGVAMCEGGGELPTMECTITLVPFF